MQFTQLWKTRSEFASHSVLRKHGRRKFLQQYTWERTMSTYGRWRISEWKEDITCDHNYVCNYMSDIRYSTCYLHTESRSLMWGLSNSPKVQKFKSSKVQKLCTQRIDQILDRGSDLGIKEERTDGQSNNNIIFRITKPTAKIPHPSFIFPSQSHLSNIIMNWSFPDGRRKDSSPHPL